MTALLRDFSSQYIKYVEYNPSDAEYFNRINNNHARRRVLYYPQGKLGLLKG